MNTILFMLKRMSLTTWIVVVGMMIFTAMSVKINIERNRRIEAEQTARILQITALNAEVLLMTTVKLTGAKIDELSDSVDVYRRRIVQERQTNLRLDAKLGQLAVANYKLTLRIDSLIQRIEAIVTDSGDSLHATFAIDQPPYRGTADVALPKVINTESRGRLELQISQDIMPITVHVSCGEELLNGVRPAFLDIGVPTYASVNLDSLTQAIEVCSPAPPDLKRGRGFFGSVWNVVKIAAVGTAGFLIGRGVSK